MGEAQGQLCIKALASDPERSVVGEAWERMSTGAHENYL